MADFGAKMALASSKSFTLAPQKFLCLFDTDRDSHSNFVVFAQRFSCDQVMSVSSRKHETTVGFES